MLNNPLGYMAYLLLRNDIVWRLLSEKEKDSVIVSNKKFNVERDDYANPQVYGAFRYEGGENWDNFTLNSDDIRMNVLHKVLDGLRPESVLEIGPGAGFYTRCICEYDTVSQYAAVDIGDAFLEFLRPRLEVEKAKRKFQYDLIVGEITQTALTGKFDLIVLLSTVHHIPNRVDLFKRLADLLEDGGAIYCFDPSHYLPRIMGLLKKCVFNGHLKREFYLNNISTHDMCSLGEYRSIVKELGNLKIENVWYKLPERLKTFSKLLHPVSLFSNQIGIVLRKISG